MNDQGAITKLRDIEPFRNAIDSLSVGRELPKNQKELVLAAAIELVDNYKLDNHRVQSLDFAYWIILNYSFQYDDYDPLFDFASCFGFYPICSAIARLGKVSDSISSALVVGSIEDNFENDGIVSTFEQKRCRNSFMENASRDIAYVAPTSFGKSELLIELALDWSSGERVCIVVPTKSLLGQTYRAIAEKRPGCSLITHDEMYSGQNDFVAVLTQERALRMLDQNKDLSFTTLFIDEAHKVFDKGERSLQLARLIRQVKQRDLSTAVSFLSPVVSDVGHFSYLTGSNIEEIRVHFNMKEPRYFLLEDQKRLCLYNRFFDSFQTIDDIDGSLWGCISGRSKDKNLLFHTSPREIRKIALGLAGHLPKVGINSSYFDFLSCLREHVHPDYDEIFCLKHGVLYLHGQMQDLVKEYLCSKVSKFRQIKYIVANSVILEGINMPIDSIFILGARGLSRADLANLIGRASRLNNVFGAHPKLERLMPEVYFVDSPWSGSSSVSNAMEKIRSRGFKDEVNNPIIKCLEGERATDGDKAIVSLEEFSAIGHSNEVDALMARMYRLGFLSIYKELSNGLVSVISERMGSFKSSGLDLFDLVCEVFVKDLQSSIASRSFGRIENPDVRRYYRRYLSDRNSLPVSRRIAAMIGVSRHRQKNGNPRMYVGDKFGECTFCGEKALPPMRPLYVDTTCKSDQEMVSLVISKFKNEDDFLGFTFAKAVRLLYENECISEGEYCGFTYGISDDSVIALVKSGIPLPVISLLEENNQLENVIQDKYGNYIGNLDLKTFIGGLDDLTRFEICEHISLDE